MDILRFITAGNVDDGKSTLIGRLLYDTGNIKADVLDSVSGAQVNLAHITDGLRSEREQGITIDVAYKYFTTRQRKYIITDAPGHFQYTRNLVTGASGVDVMIVLIDAQNGITEQTRRHALVASFLRIKNIVVAINKMDKVAYDEQVFNNIKQEFSEIAHLLHLHHIHFIPVSALLGDNISAASEHMDWYKGPTLVQYLEHAEPEVEHHSITRFAVQCLTETEKDGKGYAGKLISGKLKRGEHVVSYPNGQETLIHRMVHGYYEVSEVEQGQNIVLYTGPETELQRGDIVAMPQHAPLCGNRLEAAICWLDAAAPLKVNSEYVLRINTQETVCTITAIVNKTNISSFEKYTDTLPLEVNQFAEIVIETKDKIAFDPFHVLHETGRGIIIDPVTNYTSGAFTIKG